jgi:hypothetical protein
MNIFAVKLFYILQNRHTTATHFHLNSNVLSFSCASKLFYYINGKNIMGNKKKSVKNVHATEIFINSILLSQSD